ncbi:hypothetical protein [Mesorhizobium sp. 43Arga]
MKITNIGKEAHKLSHNGQEHLLAPGNFVEIELTKAEAAAIPAPFEATGTPIKAPKVDLEKKA